MIESVVIATDGSASVERAIRVGLDLADRFDAAVHAVSVIDESRLESSPEGVRSTMTAEFENDASAALEAVRDLADAPVVTAIRRGRPVTELVAYVRENDIDLVAMGTRGRHGEHRLLLGSVAEGMVRTCPVPVLTVRHLSG